jgi:hypothetical protein
MKMKKTKILRMLPIMITIMALPSFVAAGGRPFSTTLTGEAEVTAAGVPNQGDLDGEGTAHITLNQGEGEVCFEINVSGITLPAIGAHIHVGASTTTGPVVVGLTPPDADGSSSGCVSADPELIKAIRQNPEGYYVNVHTTDYPAGAVRGQLGK